MIGNDAMEHLFCSEEKFSSMLQVITYQQQVMSKQTGINTREKLYAALQKINAVEGEGTANAQVGLNAALESVKEISNDNPTVVFWVLGEKLGSEKETVVESTLNSLANQLTGEGDALITWQCGCDTPNELLKQYASKYIPANETEEVSASYCETNTTLYRQGMMESLEAILHEHYKNTEFVLSLEKTRQ